MAGISQPLAVDEALPKRPYETPGLHRTPRLGRRPGKPPAPSTPIPTRPGESPLFQRYMVIPNTTECDLAACTWATLETALIDTIVRFPAFAGEERALPARHYTPRFAGCSRSWRSRCKAEGGDGSKDDLGRACLSGARPWAWKAGSGRARSAFSCAGWCLLGWTGRRERFTLRSGPEQSGGGGLRGACHGAGADLIGRITCRELVSAFGERAVSDLEV